MIDRNRDQEIVIEKAEQTENSNAHLESEDIKAIKHAIQESDERYKHLYYKNSVDNSVKKKAGWFTRALAFVYGLALAVFAASVTMLDVLPVKHLSLFIAGIAVVSILIIVELCRSNVRKWFRVLMSVLCVALIAVYSMGAHYIFSTIGFLDAATEESDAKVESLTYEPFNVMITGIDVSGTIDERGRSDVNMLITVNPNTSQILITSIPRDYQIYMPDKDYEMDKLTHTGFYGERTTMLAEEDLLETDINYYVKVNFTTVVKFIDAIGGVDVYSEYAFTPLNNPAWAVEAGINHMDGEQALAFARDRKSFNEGDNQRIKNQQQVVEAIIEKVTGSPDMLWKYNDILASLKDYFKMSISSSEIKELIKMQISDRPKWKIYKNSLKGKNDSMTTYSSGSQYVYVMTQDEESVAKARILIKAVLNGEPLREGEHGIPEVAETE